VTLIPLIHTFNCNTTTRCVAFETTNSSKALHCKEIWKICGTMARLAAANLCVLELNSPIVSSRHSITGGMDIKEKKQFLSRNGNSQAHVSLDTISRYGQTDTLSNQKSREQCCHHNDLKGSSSQATTQWKNALDTTRHCWLQSTGVSSPSTSESTHTSTSSLRSTCSSEIPTFDEDGWLNM